MFYSAKCLSLSLIFLLLIGMGAYFAFPTQEDYVRYSELMQIHTTEKSLTSFKKPVSQNRMNVRRDFLNPNGEGMKHGILFCDFAELEFDPVNTEINEQLKHVKASLIDRKCGLSIEPSVCSVVTLETDHAWVDYRRQKIHTDKAYVVRDYALDAPKQKSVKMPGPKLEGWGDSFSIDLGEEGLAFEVENFKGQWALMKELKRKGS